MGRDKRNENKSEHWTKMIRTVMQTDAWRALSTTAQALYPWIKFEWHGPNANNNGKLSLSVRQAAVCIGCDRKTAGRAFHDLQAKGFIVQTEGACLGTGGEAKSPTYEVTELALPQSIIGRRLYRDWQPGYDFPVKSAPPNNPEGRNAKTKTHPCFGDRVVPIRGTN
jgi:DNA-binding transcriptional MocR family regulator